MVVRLIVQTLVSFGLMGLFLFAAAGTADWPAAWVFLVEMIVLSIVGGLWLVRHDPALVQERLAPPIQKGQPNCRQGFASGHYLGDFWCDRSYGARRRSVFLVVRPILGAGIWRAGTASIDMD
jgi:hypothetical protein